MNPLRRPKALTPPTPPVTIRPAPPPAAKVILEAHDGNEDAQLKTAFRALSAGKSHRDVAVAVMEAHNLPYHQAYNLVTEAKIRIREHIDDEGSVDAVMMGMAARMFDMQERFHAIAMSPIPQQTIDVLGPDADDPLKGAQLRPLTTAERASEIGARAQAAKVAISANDSLARIVGRRSARWADKPAQVAVQVNVGNGLSKEDQEVLDKLRIVAAGGGK